MAQYQIDHHYIPDPDGNDMSNQYVPEDGPNVSTGLFQNNYKKKDTHPDFVSDFTLTDTILKQVMALRNNGKLAVLGIAGWRKKTKNGDPYISMSISVDTYRTAKRYNCEESEIQQIMGGATQTQSQPSAPPVPADDPFFGDGGNETVGAPSEPDPFDDPLPGEADLGF